AARPCGRRGARRGRSPRRRGDRRAVGADRARPAAPPAVGVRAAAARGRRALRRDAVRPRGQRFEHRRSPPLPARARGAARSRGRAGRARARRARGGSAAPNRPREDRAELLDAIDVDSERLQRLVGDLLDLSRLEAGSVPVEHEVWSLEDIVRDAVEGLGARDSVEIVGEAPLVEVDATQVRRVLANLIENALKYSPPGTPVTVRLTATRKEAIVRVVDRGPGLAPEERERVFEPFFRRDGDTRSGAGLGLAIARGFAAANGGRLWAESRPG